VAKATTVSETSSISPEQPISAPGCDSAPKEPTPVLDVHPAPHAASTWRDFFIHIATIVIGLLIAVSLEQSVEYFHHRRLVAETREALQEEKQANIRRFHDNIDDHVMMMAYLHNNLRIFEYLRDHPGTPQDKLPGVLYWSIFAAEPIVAAWSTAEHTDVLSLMPREEVSNITVTYSTLDYSWQSYQPVVAGLGRCTIFYTQTADPSTLSPAEVATEIETIKETMNAEAVYGDTLSKIGRMPGFGPVPDWWQMLPFYKMQDYYKWVAAHPEVIARSKPDLNQARAHAGLPEASPEKMFLVTPGKNGSDKQP